MMSGYINAQAVSLCCEGDGKEKKMTYKLIPYEQLEEGEMIQFFGVHVLRWEREFSPLGITPAYAFVEDEESAELEEFHPRAMKLMRKKKNFVVVAEDEPYFIDVYKMIRSHEKEKGTWTKIDEERFLAATSG